MVVLLHGILRRGSQCRAVPRYVALCCAALASVLQLLQHRPLLSSIQILRWLHNMDMWLSGLK